jgi:hypothetical protein
MTVSTAVSGTPVQVYNPAPAGVPTMFLNNNGPATVYLGGANVTAGSGFPLPPGQSLDVSRATASVYAVSGFAASSTATTTTAAISGGATSVPVTAGTGLANGSYIEVGATTTAEVVKITSGGGTTTLTTTALSYDHASGVAVTLVTPTLTSVGSASGTV